jgi:amino acid transporter
LVKPIARRLTIAPLVAATYFMVSGGPYGLEELIAGAGYRGTMLILVVTPLLWSLPTALMIGELAAALPNEGGFYAWVKRALGPFWGFQEAWLSLMASVFDMAIYPTLFSLYLARVFPQLGAGHAPLFLGAALIAACGAWNLRGARSVGNGALILTVLLLLPFAALTVAAMVKPFTPTPAAPLPTTGLGAAFIVAMWNYMGWDNASTIAAEVERPQRSYPIAMLSAVALVAVSYVVPVAAVARVGLDPRAWTTGSWVDAARLVAGPWLANGVVIGGVICAIGMFNALILSYSRLPAALASDGFLPRALAWHHPETGAPWVAILACCVAYTACLGIGFVRLLELDVILYGSSLILEFVALIVLRIREPQLVKPFKIPGGTVVALLLALPPTALIAAAAWIGRHEQAGRLPALTLGAILVVPGPLMYWIGSRRRRWPGS